MIVKKNILFNFTYFSIVFFWSTTIFEIGTPFFINIFHISLSNIAFFTMFSSFLLILIYKGIKIKLNKDFFIFILWIFIYILFSFFGVIYSQIKFQALKETLLLLYYFICFYISIVLINYIDDNFRTKLISSIGTISYLILLIMVILQYFDLVIFNQNMITYNLKYFSPLSDYNIFIFSLLTSIW